MAAFSNSADGARREEERRHGLSAVLDPIVYSHEIGLAKPDQAAFRRAATLVGARPEAIAIVDDRPENVDAAARVGMHAVHHTETTRTIADLEGLLAR